MNSLLQAASRGPSAARAWGRLSDGRKVHRWTLRNAQDMRVDVSDLGARLLCWYAADRNGRLDDVLLGHASPAAYAATKQYLGAVVGRCANRIRAGTFALDGVTYRVDRNDRGHHLHGGFDGFYCTLWQAEPDGESLPQCLHSGDGDGGYPGNLEVELRYTLHDDGTLALDYRAHTDLATPINLTAQPYFNLGGAGADMRDHLLRIDAGEYLAVDAGMIPVGRESVAGTAFDFRHFAPLGSRLKWPDPQLGVAGGFDHCYCLPAAHGQVRCVAEAHYPSTGRRLRVDTDQPGLQLYTGQHLAGATDRQGDPYRAFADFCLEAQAFPDQINSDSAEQVVLRPDAWYRQHTRYCIDTY